MSDNMDNITKISPKKPRKIWRFVVLGIAVLLVSTALVLYLFAEELNLDAVGRWFRYMSVREQEDYGSFAFDAHSSNRYALFDDGLAIGSVGGVETHREEGTVKYRLGASMTEAALKTGKDLLLCYDVGGRSLMVLHAEKGKLLELTTEGSIYDADVSYKDTFCTSTVESGYKTVLRVYNGKQKEIYRWFSASAFMPVCAVSPDGDHLAAASVGQQGGTFESTLHVFRTDSEDTAVTVPLGEELVYDLRFVGDERICVIGSSRISWYSVSGEKIGSHELQPQYLADYDMYGDGFVLLNVNKYITGDASRVVSVDHTGKVLGQLELEEPVLNISACGKYAAVLTAKRLIICRRDLSIYAEAENIWMASDVLMRKDGTAIMVAGSSADLYIP